MAVAGYTKSAPLYSDEVTTAVIHQRGDVLPWRVLLASCFLSPQASRVEVDITLLGSYMIFIEEQCSTGDLQDLVEVSHTPFNCKMLFSPAALSCRSCLHYY